MAGFEFEIRLAGAYYRRRGLPDCLPFRISYLLKARFAAAKYKENFIFSRVLNCSFLGDNQGQFRRCLSGHPPQNAYKARYCGN